LTFPAVTTIEFQPRAATHTKEIPSMDTCQSVGHTIWDCKYPVVFIPMCKRKALHVELRRYLGEVFRNLGA
jgi:hypothetical protein